MTQQYYITPTAVRYYRAIVGADAVGERQAKRDIAALMGVAKLHLPCRADGCVEVWRVRTNTRHGDATLSIKVSYSHRAEGRLPQVISVRTMGRGS